MGFQSHWAYQEIDMSQNSIYHLTCPPSTKSQFWGRFTSAQSLCLLLPADLGFHFPHAQPPWLTASAHVQEGRGRLRVCSCGSFSGSDLKGTNKLLTQGPASGFLTQGSRVLTQALFSFRDQAGCPSPSWTP